MNDCIYVSHEVLYLQYEYHFLESRWGEYLSPVPASQIISVSTEF